MLRIGIVDDHKLFRRSMALLINSFDDVTVVAEAENGRVFLDQLNGTAVDVVLLDIEMPEMDGYQTACVLHQKYPDIKILIVSQLTTRESIHKIMELGADGYFTKNSDPAQLELAIKGLHENGFYFGSELGGVLREAILWEKSQASKSKSGSTVLFTPRELDVIKMASRGLGSSEIAYRLNLTTRTVESHRKRIMEKTEEKNFIGVILFALKNNYLNIDEL